MGTIIRSVYARANRSQNDLDAGHLEHRSWLQSGILTFFPVWLCNCAAVATGKVVM